MNPDSAGREANLILKVLYSKEEINPDGAGTVGKQTLC